MKSDPEIAAEVAAMDEAFIRHINAGDADALIDSWYTEDAVLLPPGQDLVPGRENVRQSLRELIEQGVEDFRVETKVSGHSGDLLYVIGEFSYTLPGAGGHSEEHRGKSLMVARRGSDGRWRILADMFNAQEGFPV